MSAESDESPPKRTWCEADFDDYYRYDLLRVVAFLLRLGASLTEAEDSAQYGLTKVFTAWDRLKSTNPAAYARTVAHRHYLRSQVQLAKDDDHLRRSGWATEQATPRTPEHTMIMQEEQRLHIEAMQTLPFEQRRVFAYHYDGFTPSEIAEIIGANDDTVRSNLRHARTKVKQYMTEKRKDTTRTGRRDQQS